MDVDQRHFFTPRDGRRSINKLNPNRDTMRRCGTRRRKHLKKNAADWHFCSVLRLAGSGNDNQVSAQRLSDSGDASRGPPPSSQTAAKPAKLRREYQDACSKPVSRPILPSGTRGAGRKGGKEERRKGGKGSVPHLPTTNKHRDADTQREAVTGVVHTAHPCGVR